MGRQITTVMTLRDAEDLFDTLRQQEHFLILHRFSPTAAPLVVDSIDSKEYADPGHPWLFYSLVREDDLGSVLTREVRAGYWSIDDLFSPVIDFTPSFHADGKIRAGRFWFGTRYFGSDDELVVKPEPFLHWGDQLLKTTRKLLTKSGDHWVGAEARARIAAGELEVIP